jgi:hypothetical protein
VLHSEAKLIAFSDAGVKSTGKSMVFINNYIEMRKKGNIIATDFDFLRIKFNLPFIPES